MQLSEDGKVLLMVEEKDIVGGKFDIPNSVTKIGKNAFDGCSALEEVVIPDSVTEIKDWAFFMCESLEEVYMTDSVTIIGDRAFAECYNLKKVKLSNSIETIPFACFQKCDLEEINIPANVKVIERFAFACNAKLERVKFLGNNLKRIEEQAFWECSSLEKVGLPKGLEVIEKGAFFDCDNLKQVFIPDTITVIEDRAFYKCKSLKKVDVPSEASVHAEAFPKDTVVALDNGTIVTDNSIISSAKGLSSSDKVTGPKSNSTASPISTLDAILKEAKGK